LLAGQLHVALVLLISHRFVLLLRRLLLRLCGCRTGLFEVGRVNVLLSMGGKRGDGKRAKREHQGGYSQ